MKLLLFLTTSLALLVSQPEVKADSKQKPGPSDTEIRSSIVATWIVDLKSKEMDLKGTVTILPNGKFVSEASIIPYLPGRIIKMAYEGDWSVKDGFLIETVTKTNDEAVVPLGCLTRDKILRISHDEFTYLSEDGETETRVRKKGD